MQKIISALEWRNMKNNMNNFGVKGWGIIIYAGLCMFINGIIHTNGINILLGMINGMHGWETSTMLTINTVAGIIGVLSSFITGRLIIKFGAKKIGGIYLIVGGLIIMWFGHVNSLAAFFMSLTFLWVMSDGYGQMVPFTLTANWFPRKKGIALGWSTMGYAVAGIFTIPILLFFIGNFGYSNAFYIIGGIQIVMGIIMLTVVKNYAEEAGAYPDNDKTSKEQLQAMIEHRKHYKSKLTVKKLLRDKDMWSIAFMMGFLWMGTIGFVSQLVPRLIGVGYTQDAATHFLQLEACCGIFGSYFFGWLDQKIGTRKTTMIYSLSYVVVFIVMGTTTSFAGTLFVCLFGGFGTGAICNLLPSFIGTVYGRDDFAIANGVVSPIASMLRCLNFLILALGLMIGGTYAPAYLIFGILSIASFLLAMRTKTVFINTDPKIETTEA